MTLVRRLWLGSLELTDYPYSLEFGSDQGNPDGEVVTFESLLADGGIESLTRRANREMTIPILVEGPDLAAIFAAEEALVLECDRTTNTLTLDPGDGFATPIVFDTMVVQAKRVTGSGSDEAEMAGLRRWVLEIRALPFARSPELVIDDAGSPPSSGVEVYAADSITGWSTYATTGPHDYDVDTTIVPEGATDSIRALAQDLNGVYFDYYSSALNLDRITFPMPIDTTTGGYLALPIRTTWNESIPGSPDSGSRLYQLWMTTAEGGEVEVTDWVTTGRDANGFVRYAWTVDADLTVTGLRTLVSQYRLMQFADRPEVWYGPIELSTAATDEHQIVKQHFVQGSARTTGSLRIAAPSESVALGQVLAMTVPTYALPAGFQPDGARWATNGDVTPDAGALHGGYYTPNGAYAVGSTFPVFDIPVNMLTAGPYVAVALVKADSLDVSFGVQAQLRIGSTNTGPTSVAEISTTVLATGYNFIPVGTIDLSPLPMQGADETAKVRLLFQGDEFADIFLIPAWQVSGQPVADFSIVDCGTGTVSAGGASSSLWIDSPDTAQSEGGWWRGPNPERSMARSAWPNVRWPGVHTFKPGPMTAFVVSLGAAGPTSTLEYFPRYL